VQEMTVNGNKRAIRQCLFMVCLSSNDQQFIPVEYHYADNWRDMWYRLHYTGAIRSKYKASQVGGSQHV
jgi:hypothetical protein